MIRRRPTVIAVDRDSVAAGDDIEPHARELSVASGTRLSALLALAAPEIRARGWSWVAMAEGRPLAVWSVDHGVQLLVPDRRVTGRRGPHAVHFRYLQQIDPAWLHRRLAEGAPMRPRDLEEAYRPIATAVYEREQRRREAECDERLISPECVGILESFGSRIALHNDRLLRFELCGARWSVARLDTMTRIEAGDDRTGGASIRPAALAECWLVAAVAAVVREEQGIVAIPDHPPETVPELRRMGDWPPGNRRWSTVGEPTAQLHSERAVDCFSLACGRSIAEIAALMRP